MFEYNPRQWYWVVGSDERVYSSGRKSYIAGDDEAYTLWVSGGGIPTRIASEEELRVVLKKHGLLFSYREEKRSEIRREYAAAMDQIAGAYPDRERETWHKQLSEARALDADPEAATPYINACIAESGEDKSAFADNILGKDSAYAKHAGQAAGVMRRRLRELEAATTAEEIEAV